MSDLLNKLSDEEAANAAGGAYNGGYYDAGPAPHANGTSWPEGGIVKYRIAYDDYLGNIAQRFGTSVGALMNLNVGHITNADKIRANDIIRVR